MCENAVCTAILSRLVQGLVPRVAEAVFGRVQSGYDLSGLITEPAVHCGVHL